MSEWKDYRKRPLKIQAKQMTRTFKVKTLEGTMKGKKGDYLVIGIKGERYPVNKDIFEKTYYLDRVSEELKIMRKGVLP